MFPVPCIYNQGAMSTLCMAGGKHKVKLCRDIGRSKGHVLFLWVISLVITLFQPQKGQKSATSLGEGPGRGNIILLLKEPLHRKYMIGAGLLDMDIKRKGLLTIERLIKELRQAQGYATR